MLQISVFNCKIKKHQILESSHKADDVGYAEMKILKAGNEKLN